jgi:hypothetical protein
MPLSLSLVSLSSLLFLWPPSIDQLVGLLSVSRVTARAHCHVLVGALHELCVVTTVIFEVRKFRENFEAQNPCTRNFPEIST